MRLLLDTHTLLWALAGSPLLSRTARRTLEDGRNEKWISVVSLWELTIKSALGKLHLHEPLADLLDRLEQTGFVRTLPIATRHLLRLSTLPPHHGDPFDRLIIAQAFAENLTLLSADAKFDAYGVSRSW